MVGLQIDQLPEDFQAPMKTYLTNGAIEKVGKIKKAEILTRGHKNPVHKTTFGKDGEEVRTAVTGQSEDYRAEQEDDVHTPCIYRRNGDNEAGRCPDVNYCQGQLCDLPSSRAKYHRMTLISVPTRRKNPCI
ncbi:hypothetical protein E4U28_007824 [Claviceps purpurea]|nr:hypothetical protein E4U28_007824 [Claviceps purpurea]